MNFKNTQIKNSPQKSWWILQIRVSWGTVT
jgi:hypothetical protein